MNTLTRRSAITVSATATCWALTPRNARANEPPTKDVAAPVTAPEDLDGFADTIKKVVQLEHRVGIQGLDAYTPGEPSQVSR